MSKDNILKVTVTILFTLGALYTEKIGLSIPLYYYNPNWSTVFGVPMVVIVGWVILDHLAWFMYRRVGLIAGFTPLCIDFVLEFLAHNLEWWTWILPAPQFTVFGAPALNYVTYVVWGFTSIWLCKGLGVKSKVRR